MITSINGTAVAASMSYKVDYNSQSTEDSGRSLDGVMHNNFLPFKYKLFCKWPPQTIADRATLMTAIYSGANLSDLDVVFLDPISGTYIERNFMIGTPSSQSLISVWNDGTGMWDGLEVNFIEN